VIPSDARWLVVLSLLGPLATTRADDAPPSTAPALKPVAPVLPDAVIAAIQESRFDEAAAQLETLSQAAKPEDRPYFALVSGAVLRAAAKVDAARAALRKGIDADPKGPWVTKLSYELALVELAAGRPRDAEPLARAQAEKLLDVDRKDRLAAVYQQIAERLLQPEGPLAQPDFEGGYQLLDEARKLAKGKDLRARLLLAMGRVSLKAGNPARALRNFQDYLKEHPKATEVMEARFGLGEALFAAGQALPARLTWADLARELEKVDDAKAKELRARALYQVALTHGIPNPPDETQLNLGVAALRRYLADYPGHRHAVQAAYQIGGSYLARGKSQDALNAFTAFLKGQGFQAESDEAKKDLATLAMAATFQVGQVLQGQERFAEAIAAFKGYLAQYPNGPQAPDAQRSILDTQLLIADEHLRLKRYDQARAAWTAFATENPLDGRVPQVLYQIGQS
jgi:TolA-binding protein